MKKEIVQYKIKLKYTFFAKDIRGALNEKV